MGARYYHSWSAGRGRRSGISVPLHWLLLYYAFFWWLILFVLLCSISWHVIKWAYRYLRRAYRDAQIHRSRR